MDPSGKNSKSLKNQIKFLEEEILSLHNELAVLRESETKYRSLFEKASDALIVVASKTLEIEDANRFALQLFGFSKKEFIHRRFQDICEEKEQTLSAVLNGISNGSKERRIISGKFIKKNRTVFPGAVYSVSFESQGEIIIFVSIRDVSEKLKTEEQLIKSREQLFQAQKMEALGTLVAGVAHEINNPINLIMYNIPLISRIWHDFKPVFESNEQKFPDMKFGGLTYQFIYENLDQLIEDMDLAAKRVETIVRRLKDFARKSDSFEKSDISVNDAVENALRLAQSTLRKSKVLVNTTFYEKIPRIKAHLQSIEQVVLNLVINAIEAIDHDHGEIYIDTSYAENEKMIVVKVRDNGKGMSSETREKIFDPFFTEKQADGGTGLGLSVSYSLIKSHEGDILCRSEAGKGTVFEIRLPLEPEKKLLKVLVADDDPALRKLLAQAFKKDGNFSVEMTSNGTEALIKLGTYLPDLLILDLFMPQMNGLEVCRAIMNENKLSKMKVVIITGLPKSPEIEEIKKIGYVNIFAKPLDIKQFVRDVSGLF